MPMPRALYVAAAAAPSLDRQIGGWDGPDEGLARYMKELGGTPALLLEDQELLGEMVATLRADLTVLSTHTYQPEVLLDIPITAFAGAVDEESSPPQMEPWGAETTEPFVMNILDAGHFFDQYAVQQVIDMLVADLLGTTTGDRGTGDN